MNYYDIFAKHIPDLKSDREQQLVKCIFHQDDKPSLSINTREGLFHCFGCGKKGGIKEFCDLVGENFDPTKIERTNSEQEKEEVFIELEERIVHKNIDKFHARLMSDKTRLSFLLNEKMFSKKIIETLKIGLEDNRFIIPIWKDDVCVAVIQYQPNSYPKYKLVRYDYARYEGCFPHKSFYETNYVVVCEGISDTIALLSVGINAITPLVPSSPFKWLAKFDFTKIEHIVIVTDNDTAGELIRRKYNEFFNALQGKRVYNIYLPEEYKDVAEYLKHNTKQSFVELVNTAKKKIEQDEQEYEMIEFEDIFDMKNIGKKIKVEAFTTSKLIQSYAVPSKFTVSCEAGRFDYCKDCFVYLLKMSTEKTEVSVPEEEQIAQIDKPTEKFTEKVRKKLGVPSKCNSLKINITSYNLAEMFDIIPIKGTSTKEIGFRPVACIALSKSTILSSSANYKIKGTITTHPNNGQLIIITKSAESFDRVYKYNAELEDELAFYLRPQEITVETILEKLFYIGNDLSKYTGIKKRDMFHILAILPFTSPYQMMIDDQYEKSALEIFVIGDTRTGKTTIFRKFIELTNIGTLISGENISIAGLVGGMQQLSYGKWTISWGILPQNDRGLVIIDEADALPKEVISGMTSVRSSGWAEINKVQQARANARVRMVLISNPKNNMNMESYGCGIQAVEDFEYSKQDISRFDYFSFLSRTDVKAEDAKYSIEKTSIPLEVYRNVAQRAYAQSAIENIIPEDIKVYAIEIGEYLSNKYYCDIPIFSEGYAFLKVLKIALAVKNLLVIPLTHEVLIATQKLIEMNYDDKTSDLHNYALMWREQMLVNKSLLAKILLTVPNLQQFAKKLFMREKFTYSFFQEIAGCNVNDAYALYLKPLIEANAIYSAGKRGEYVKTPEFTNILSLIISGDLKIDQNSKSFVYTTNRR